jgi:orotidine-5'-phosphate decarboxylase
MIPEMIRDGLHRAPTDLLPSDRLIVALDFPDIRAALALVDRLHGATRWLKVGLELYIA